MNFSFQALNEAFASFVVGVAEQDFGDFVDICEDLLRLKEADILLAETLSVHALEQPGGGAPTFAGRFPEGVERHQLGGEEGVA